MEFEKWLNELGAVMQLHGFIRLDQELNAESWKPYFDEGLTWEQTLITEFGENWHLHKPKSKP